MTTNPSRISLKNKLLIASALITAAGAAAVPMFADITQAEARAIVRPVPAPAAPAESKPAEPGVAGEPGEAPKPRDPREPGNPMDRAADSGSQVYVSDSFAAVERLREALRLMKQARAQEAITKFQGIINEFGQKLVYLNNDSYASITDYCREQLVKIPAVSQGMYDTLFGGEAKEALKAPLAARDIAEVARLCDRYFCSTAALAALAQISEWHFERGEFSTAARIWQLLVTHPRATPEQKAEYLHHAAIAEKLSGRGDLAKNLRDKLSSDYADATGIINGKNVNLVESVDALLAGKEEWESSATLPDEWPQLGGSAQRNVVPDVNASAGARLWSQSFDDEAIAGDAAKKAPVPVLNERIARMRRPNGPADDQPLLTSYPILSGGTLLVHTGDRVIGLSANAGNILWAYPQRDILPRTPPNMQQMMINNYGMVIRFPYVDAVAAFDNVVYAILPGSPSGAGANRSGYLANFGLNVNNKLVALNRSTGQEVWSKPVVAGEINTEGKNASNENMALTFIGSPVVTRQGVFVMARKISRDGFAQFHLVRIDRESGEVSWTCYICSTGGLGYAPSPSSNRVPIPTIADDVVYVSTGQGADAAIDANAGRIQWLQITENAKVKPANPNMRYNPGNFASIPSWKFNPPLVRGDKLVTYEMGGAVRIYERWSGKLLWKKDRKELGDVDVIAGFHGNELITVGSGDHTICAVNIDTFKEEWALDQRTDTGKMQGRPFLAKNLLYVPYEQGLLIVDLEKKKTADFSAWPKNEQGKAGEPGNILVTSEQIIVINDTEIAGYSRWETARDNRLARIKADPANPAPYLALAEISFRTNHFDLAQENLAKSVELAVTPAAPADQELRQRLYRTSMSFAELLLAKKTDIDVRDRARFYFEQAKLTAYNADTQAEWRLGMSNLSRAQQKWSEAAELFNSVLNDTGIRNAPYRHGDSLARAGVTAELAMKSLIEEVGKPLIEADDKGKPDYPMRVDAAGRDAVYKPFEALAAGALTKARAETAGARNSALMGVIDSFPNSRAAIDAGTQLAAASPPLEAIKTLRWLYPRVLGQARAQVIADLAVTSAAAKRWNAALSWADRGARSYADFNVKLDGKEVTSAALRDSLRAKLPDNIEGRRPTLPLPRIGGDLTKPSLLMDTSPILGPDANRANHADLTFAAGFLLSPIEQAPLYRKPDAFFVFSKGEIRMFGGPDFKAPWDAITLPDNSTTVLLGSYGNISVFVQQAHVVGIDTVAGKVKWNINLSMADADRTRLTALENKIKQDQIQEMQMRGVQAGMVYDPQTGTYYNATMTPAALAVDPDVGRNTVFNERLGKSQLQFSTMRMIGSRLVVVTGSSLAAYDLTTGENAWKDRAVAPLPDGLPTAVIGNDDLIIAQVDSENLNPTFRILDAASGKFISDITLKDERFAWRGLSDDGFLFVVTDSSVSAYDCFALNPGGDGKDAALWRRDDIKVKWATASAITLDGLMLVNANNDLVCLSAEGGEYRWPLPPATAPHLSMPMGVANPQQGMAGWTFLRSYVDGDQVIYQTQTGIEAYYTADGEASWKSSMNDPEGLTSYAPMSLSQLADPYIVSLATGALPNGRRAAAILSHDRRPGKGRISVFNLSKPGSENGAPIDPPIIRNWQIIDNAIVMETMGKIFVYRATPEEKKPEDKK